MPDSWRKLLEDDKLTSREYLEMRGIPTSPRIEQNVCEKLADLWGRAKALAEKAVEEEDAACGL